MKGPFTLGLSGTDGIRVREAGRVLMGTLARSGLHAWGRCRRRDDAGITRFRISAGVSPGTMVPRRRILEADLDASRILTGEKEFEVPVDRLGPGGSKSCVVLGAMACLYGISREAGTAVGEDWTAGFDYASANFPALETPSPEARKGGLGEVFVMTGRSAYAAGALCAGCRYAAGTVSLPEFSEIASAGLPFALEPCKDGDAAVYRAAAAGYAGVRAMAVVDERAYRRAEEALLWAARAEIPLVLLVLDAEESSYGRAPALAGPSAPGVVLAPSSVEDLFHAMGEAFSLSEKFRSPVTLLADRLLTERWETLEKPVTAKTAGDSGRAVPGQEGKIFTGGRAGSEEELRAKCERMRAEADDRALTRGSAASTRCSKADATFICAGGISVVVRWAVDKINGGAGRTVDNFTIRTLIPFLESASYDAIRKSKRLIVVEGTPGRPIHRWLRMAAGIDAPHVVSLRDPFDPEATLNALLEAVESE